MAHSKFAFLTLVASVLALAVAAQYAMLIAGGAHGALSSARWQAAHAWQRAHDITFHFPTKAADVMHGASHWAWASADTGAAAAAREAAGARAASRFATPWWLGGSGDWVARPRGAWQQRSAAQRGGSILDFVMPWRRRSPCAPPLKRAFARRVRCGVRCMLRC